MEFCFTVSYISAEPTCNSSIWPVFYDYHSLFLGEVSACNACLVHCQLSSPRNFQTDNVYLPYSDSFVQLLGYVKAYFHLPYRQTEDVVRVHTAKKVPSIPNYSLNQPTSAFRISNLVISVILS